jgi:hypothetical protein
MKTRLLHSAAKARRVAGVSLIECLVYIGLLFVIVGCAYLALYHATDNNKALRRNADDIAAALNVGERWRQDVRDAVGPIRVENIETNQIVRIPQRQGEVVYAFVAGRLSRQSRADAPSVVVLPRVNASVMAVDARTRVKAWRWDLILQSKTRTVRLKPGFSFAAVPGTKEAP